jgi:hypothetical protein
MVRGFAPVCGIFFVSLKPYGKACNLPSIAYNTRCFGRIGVLKPTGWLTRAAKQVVDDFFTIVMVGVRDVNLSRRNLKGRRNAQNEDQIRGQKAL